MSKSTRISLLLRVRDPADDEAWREFYELYGPLIYSYARSRGLHHDDAEEIKSVCLESLVESMKTFEYEKSKGGFRAFLRTMVHRRIVDRLRKRRELLAESGQLESIADKGLDAAAAWDQATTRRYLAYCVERVRDRVSPQTSTIFDLLTRDRLSVAEVCDREQVSANHVYKVKSRMIEMIRKEMDLLDPGLLQ